MEQGNNDFSWRIEKFDTDIFGFAVAKILFINPNGTPTELNNRVKILLKDLKNKKISYASYRFSATQFSLIHALENSGFLLVDGFISFEKTLNFQRVENIAGVRTTDKEDRKVLRFLGSKIFSFSRLYNDPFIQREKANRFFMEWIENCIKGKAADKVLVYEQKGNLIGFVALQRKGHITLIGVDYNYQGKGIAKKLLAAAFLAFKDWGVKKISIGTQVANIPAIRAYIACGFNATSCEFSFSWHS